MKSLQLISNKNMSLLKRLPTKVRQPAGGPAESAASTSVCPLPKDTDNKLTPEDIAIKEGLQQLRDSEEGLPSFMINEIVMSIWSYEELSKEAVVRVTNPNFSGSESVNDIRMGLTEDKLRCGTCGQDTKSCPGHIGMIDFGSYRVPKKTGIKTETISYEEKHVMIYHPMFITEIVKVLNCVCKNCGRLRLKPETLLKHGLLKEVTVGEKTKLMPQYSSETQLSKMDALMKSLPVCEQSSSDENENESEGKIIQCSVSPEYSSQRGKDKKQVYAKKKGSSFKNEDESLIPIEEVYKIINNISDTDVGYLGFRQGVHPKRSILRAIPVIPPTARQPHILSNRTHQHQLTMTYQLIVQQVQRIKEANAKSDEKEKYDMVNKLSYLIEKMIDNSKEQKLTIAQKPLEGFKQMLTGKEGIIRNLLMGKRVNFSARDVIDPEPYIKLSEVRVPDFFAPIFTVEVTITDYNRDAMQDRLRNGRVNTIRPASGEYKGILRNVRKDQLNKYELHIGDKIERWLEDGDPLLLNRQPTLHKAGMMGVRAYISKLTPIGVHPSQTTPFNADFDGDEMNLHDVQDILARAEVAIMASVPSCIMNAQTNAPIMGIVMDGITGGYLLTDPKTMVDLDDILYYYSLLKNKDSLASLQSRLVKYNVDGLSGRALFSALLPEDFFYSKGEVRIREGVLLSGQITKPDIGPGASGSIIAVLNREYGSERTEDFFSDATILFNEYLSRRGFSIGIDDCMPPDKSLRRTIDQIIEVAILQVNALGEAPKDLLGAIQHEKQIMSILRDIVSIGGKEIIEKLPRDNALYIMAKAGSKGSVLNIAQIMGFLGQQMVNGERLKPTLSKGTRCFPSYDENSLELGARGFCLHAFIQGLTPTEYFAHMAGTRVGMTDTAIKTGEVGHMHKKVVKALEDIRVAADGTVRNATNIIFQFVYGDDGFDAAELSPVKTKAGTATSFIDLRSSAERINTMYGF
jgi:DNA-directed RNA polymerase II subunit RPB1